MSDIVHAFQIRNWYALAALALTLLIQLGRKSPYTSKLWNLIPTGWRWVPPVLSGGATGFVLAFRDGQSLAEALLAALGGVLGLSFTSMGFAAALKESPLSWDGGAGGASGADRLERETLPPPPSPPSIPDLFTLALGLGLCCASLSIACGTRRSALWPAVATCAAEVSRDVLDRTREILFHGGDYESALEQLATQTAPEAVLCAVHAVVEAWTSEGVASNPETLAARERGRLFLAETGTKIRP